MTKVEKGSPCNTEQMLRDQGRWLCLCINCVRVKKSVCVFCTSGIPDSLSSRLPAHFSSRARFATLAFTLCQLAATPFCVTSISNSDCNAPRTLAVCLFSSPPPLPLNPPSLLSSSQPPCHRRLSHRCQPRHALRDGLLPKDLAVHKCDAHPSSR